MPPTVDRRTVLTGGLAITASVALAPFAQAAPPVKTVPKILNAPWFGAHDGARGKVQLEAALANATGEPSPIRSFVRGYSGAHIPDDFEDSAVSDGDDLGVGAVLNTKSPTTWQAIVDGDHDDLWTDLLESWPVEVFGDLACEHEPENPFEDDNVPENPAWVDWADDNGPIWVAAQQRLIRLAKPIIETRGLQVRIAPTLMAFRPDRWEWFQWWDGLTNTERSVCTLGVDAYWKHGPSGNPQDFHPVIDDLISRASAYGLGRISLLETAIDRRQVGTGAIVGTNAGCAAWLEDYAAYLSSFGLLFRTVTHFHSPDGEASAQAQLKGVMLETWGDICLNGRR